MAKGKGFSAYTLHSTTIPQLEAGGYLVGFGGEQDSSQKDLVAIYYPALQNEKDRNLTPLYGATAEIVQAKAYKILHQFNASIAAGIAPSKALVQILDGLQPN